MCLAHSVYQTGSRSQRGSRRGSPGSEGQSRALRPEATGRRARVGTPQQGLIDRTKVRIIGAQCGAERRPQGCAWSGRRSVQRRWQPLPAGTASRVAAEIKRHASGCRNEAQFRSRVHPIVERLLRRIDPALRPMVDDPISGPSGARGVPDVIWGTTILDYKNPAGRGRLATAGGRAAVRRDLARYLDTLVASDRGSPEHAAPDAPGFSRGEEGAGATALDMRT
jgi:hypothetical protein